MLPGQTLQTIGGTEVMLFPVDEMYITQGEGGALSHMLAMDFVGWDGSAQINLYPYYAPCTCKCVDKNISQAWCVFESLNPVLCADGTIRTVSFVVMHDDNMMFNIGDTVNQGDLLGHTGTSGYALGDHLHLNTAFGAYAGWTTGYSFNELLNSSHIYDTCFVNDTIMYNDLGYNWKTYTGPILEKSKNWTKFILSKRRKVVIKY